MNGGWPIAITRREPGFSPQKEREKERERKEGEREGKEWEGEGEREEGRKGKGERKKGGRIKVPKTSLEFLHPVVLESAPHSCFQVKTVNSSFACGCTQVFVGFLLFEAKRVLTNITFKYWYKLSIFLNIKEAQNYNISEGEQVMAS